MYKIFSLPTAAPTTHFTETMQMQLFNMIPDKKVWVIHDITHQLPTQK